MPTTARILGMLVLIALAGEAVGREWADKNGKFRVEAEALAVKDGSVYLQKPDGTVTQVSLENLSQSDLTYLLSLPKYRDYFAMNPVPGVVVKKPLSLVSIQVDDESKVGLIRSFSDIRWGITSLAFSANAGLLAAGKMDNALMVFDLNSSKRVSFEKNLGSSVSALAFTPDGKRLLSGGRGPIQVWNVATDGQLTKAHQLVGHSQEVRTISISQNGKNVLSGGSERKARYWDLEAGRELFGIDGFHGPVKAARILPNGTEGMVADGEVLSLIDLANVKAEWTIKLGRSPHAQSVSISPDGSRVVVSDTYALRMWEIRTGRELPKLQDQEIQWASAFSPDGKYVISGGRGKINLWEAETARKVYEVETAGTTYIKAVAYSPDRRHISGVSSSAGPTLQVFRLPAKLSK